MSDQDNAVRNFDVPSKELALEQIFNATGYLVPTNKIEFGFPELIDVFPDVPTDENSFIPAVIDPLEDARFNGDNGFLYRRLRLDELPNNDDIPSVPITYPFSVHEQLALINSFLGTQLDETDLENDTFTQAPVILRVKVGSLAWIGDRVAAPINPGHHYLINQPVLPGFTEYVAGIA